MADRKPFTNYLFVESVCFNINMSGLEVLLTFANIQLIQEYNITHLLSVCEVSGVYSTAVGIVTGSYHVVMESTHCTGTKGSVQG